MANKVLNTRIALRGDTKENWESKNPVLLKNEMGIELGATAADNKIKIGDGITAWKDLGYTYDLSALASKIGSKAQIYTLTKDSRDVTDEATLATITSPQNSDVAVVKTIVDEVEYGLSAYYYDGNDAQWIAINGNVDADKVILTQDFVLAGNYVNVGNFNKGSNAATKTVTAKGGSVQSLLTKMFSEELQPSIAANVSGGITLSGAGAKEVGTEFTPSYSTSFNKGSYSYEPKDTGVSVTKYEITDTDGNTASTANGSFAKFTVDDDTNYSITAKMIYSDGAIAKTNLGNDSNPVVRIAAGSMTKTSAVVTGYRPMFTYVGTDVTTLDGAWVRSKGSNKGNSVAPGDLTIAEGTKRVMFAVPKAKNKTLKSVIDVDGMGLDVKDNFTHVELDVAGANGHTAATYDVWYVDNANGLSKTTYKVTLG